MDDFEALRRRPGIERLGTLPVRHARRAVRRSAPTIRHATRAFLTAADALGDQGWIDPAGGDTIRALYRRDPARSDWLVPVPIVTLRLGGGGRVVGPMLRLGSEEPPPPADAPEGWTAGDAPFDPEDPPPDLIPRGPDMKAGRLEMREGQSLLELGYGPNGLFAETVESPSDWLFTQHFAGVEPFTHDPLARPPLPRPLGVFCRADLAVEGHDATAFGAMLAELDPGDRVPARLRLPCAIPGGVGRALRGAISGLRRALWDDHVPDDARWVAVDGLAGTAIGWGATRDEALLAWEESVINEPPRPPELTPAPIPLRPRVPPQEAGPIHDEAGNVIYFSSGLITLRGEGPAVPQVAWPEPLASHTPVLLVPLPGPAPAIPHAFAAAGSTRWVRLVGEHGTIHRVLKKDDAEGFTLIGSGVLDAVDPARLDAAIAVELAKMDAFMADDSDWPGPPLRAKHSVFLCWDSASRRPSRSASCRVARPRSLTRPASTAPLPSGPCSATDSRCDRARPRLGRQLRP